MGYYEDMRAEEENERVDRETSWLLWITLAAMAIGFLLLSGRPG